MKQCVSRKTEIQHQVYVIVMEQCGFDRGNWMEASVRNTDIFTVFCKSKMVAK